jgi:hypothetical protein
MSFLTRTGERVKPGRLMGLLEGVRAAPLPSKAKFYHRTSTPRRCSCSRTFPAWRWTQASLRSASFAA